MALTKSNAEIDGWAEVAQASIREGAAHDVSGCYDAMLHIDEALTSETAQASGARIVVEVSSEDAGDESWSELAQLGGQNGTAGSEQITNNPAAQGETTLTVAGTTGFATKGAQLFLKDVDTFANSEIVRQTGFTTNVSVTILDGTARSHGQNSVLYNKCSTKMVALPLSAKRVRVIYDNTRDAAGSTIATRCRISKTTGV